MENLNIVQSEFGSIKVSIINYPMIMTVLHSMKAPVGNLRFREAQPTDKWEIVI